MSKKNIPVSAVVKELLLIQNLFPLKHIYHLLPIHEPAAPLQDIDAPPPASHNTSVPPLERLIDFALTRESLVAIGYD